MKFTNDLIDLLKINDKFSNTLYSPNFLGCFVKTRDTENSSSTETISRTIEIDDKCLNTSAIAEKYGDQYNRSMLLDLAEFHPDGRCGCIKKDDDYFFGRRANHFIVISGWLEHLAIEIPVFLIICNHKGSLSEMLVQPIVDIGKGYSPDNGKTFHVAQTVSKNH